MDALEAASETAIHQCMQLQSDESCLIVTDDVIDRIGDALYHSASAVTDDTALIRYPPLEQHGMEPADHVAAAMAASDVVLAPTSKSLSHTRARSRACRAGARIATLPGITIDVFTTGLDADYQRIAAECERVLAQVADATELRITAPAGTDLTFRPGDRTWRSDTGIVHEPGDFSNLPAGEVFVSPETADGTYVIDGTIRPHGLLDPTETISFTVVDGYVTDISDEAIRAELETAADAVGRNAYNLAEVGIGTNIGVTTLIGSVLLDEKAAGTVHVAVGDDASIGGDTDAPIHMDGIIRDPTVIADGKPIDLPG